jgi:hypothetical protein
MYAVSQAFQDAVRADERRVVGRVTIDYTDPFLDQSINVSANEQARISWPAQTADGVEAVPYKWAALDGTWVLDGTWRLAPDTPEDANQYQMGWWGGTLAGAGGAFSAPYPALTVMFDPRPVHSLKVTGDNARGEYPVDFTVRLYDSNNTVVHTETVAGNAAVAWSKPLPSPILNVAKMTLEVQRWSHPGRQVKITEFYSSIQETYEDERIIELSLLEEREADQGSLPVGNISANEISIRLDNSDRRFDPGNTASPLYGLIKANRRVRAWLGVQLPDQTIEWVPLGVFWAVDWEVSDSSSESTARVVARDRLELLRQSTYESAQVSQNVSLYALAESVLQDAGLKSADYILDPALQQFVVPYAWFDSMSHRDALRVIAEAALGQVYCDREGRVRVTVGQTYQPTTQRLFLEGAPFPAEVPAVYEAYGISPDDYFSLSTPSRQGQLANEIIVDTQPLRTAAMSEVYRSNEPIVVPVGQTVNIVAHYNIPPVINASARLEGATDTDILTADYYGWGAEIVLYNAGTTDEQVTLIIEGQPLQVQNKERAVAKDDASIRDNGRLRFEFPANHLVQSLPVAQQIASGLLSSYKDPRRDIRLEWRGNPALELGDLITVPESPDKTRRGYFVVVRQELTWAGALSAVVEGRRVTSL